MRTLIICHHDAPLDREGLVRWLGSFSTVAGVVAIRESSRRRLRRIMREVERVGLWRFLDVLAFRAHYAMMHAAGDRRWELRELDRLRAWFHERPEAPELTVSSPNTHEVETFIRDQRPDLVLARCRTLLTESIFSIAPLGTFAMHPGICPEYRNAHGCFWALSRGDEGNIGMTLLRIDRGVDTGPVYGYFRVNADPAAESHIITQHRTVLDHLDAIRDSLVDIAAGRAIPIETAGRPSAVWGQPWLSVYMRMHRERAARIRSRVPTVGAL